MVKWDEGVSVNKDDDRHLGDNREFPSTDHPASKGGISDSVRDTDKESNKERAWHDMARPPAGSMRA